MLLDVCSWQEVAVDVIVGAVANTAVFVVATADFPSQDALAPQETTPLLKMGMFCSTRARRCLILLLFLIRASKVASFSSSSRYFVFIRQNMFMLRDIDPRIEIHTDDDDFIEPGMMRVSEIKSELALREVSCEDCFDKESLVQRLQEARATGKADPNILDKFNRQRLEQDFSGKKVDIEDDVIQSAVAEDGRLPGGLTPDVFKTLTGNPEIMEMLQNTKMQEAMKLMMTGGRDELESKLRDDSELRAAIEKLDTIMRSL